jgi:TetR/AcrR family transcriptional repressor of mexJK operon
VLEAGRTLFLRKGYAGTTLEEVAAQAGLTKRTVYNNYADKDALFTEIVAEVTAYASAFARNLSDVFTVPTTTSNVGALLGDLGERLALSVLRQEVVALRRLLIGEAREFPALAKEYYDRAPGQVIDALAEGFARLAKVGLLRVPEARLAAVQFAYLVVGEPLDRAMLVGRIPPKDHVMAHAREGVATFLARYAVTNRERKRRGHT